MRVALHSRTLIKQIRGDAFPSNINFERLRGLLGFFWLGCIFSFYHLFSFSLFFLGEQNILGRLFSFCLQYLFLTLLFWRSIVILCFRKRRRGFFFFCLITYQRGFLLSQSLINFRELRFKLFPFCNQTQKLVVFLFWGDKRVKCFNFLYDFFSFLFKKSLFVSLGQES